MFPSINRQLASSLQKSDGPAHHKALGAEWTSVSEIRRDAFARAGWDEHGRIASGYITSAVRSLAAEGLIESGARESGNSLATRTRWR